MKSTASEPGLSFEIEIWRDKYLLLLLSKSEKKRATKILIIVVTL